MSGSDYDYEDDALPFVSCYIAVSSVKEKKMLFYLDMGMRAVIEFSRLADSQKITGAIKIDRKFSCNVDVEINGANLLSLIREHYNDRYEMALKVIEPEEIYTIFCCDLS